MNDMIPRQPKRKRQPTAEMMREQLRLAADEIIRLRDRLQPYQLVDEILRPGSNPPPPSGPKPQPPPNPSRSELQMRASGASRARAETAMARTENSQHWWNRIFRSKSK